MATVTGMTAAHTQAILDTTVVDADINVSGDLIFTRHDGSTFDAGSALPAIPYASNAETQAGTITNKSVTPASLASTGFVKTLATNALAESAPITSYPNGVSYMAVGAGSGWSISGGFGLVITHFLSTTRSIQWFHANQTADTWVRNYYDTDTPQWEPWKKVVASDLSGNVTLAGDITAAKGRFGGAGPSAAVYIGDDGTLNDVNLSNLIGVQGQQDPNQGGFAFGSSSDTRAYRSGGQRLKVENELDVATQLYVGGVSVGKGAVLAATGFGGSSSGSGTTSPGPESGLNTSASNNSMVWQNGHIYKIIVTYIISDNINSSFSVAVFRVYSSGGVGIGGESHTCVANGHLGMGYTGVYYAKRVAGSNLTAGIGFTIQRYFSGVAGTNFLDGATVTVEDMGLASDHASYSAICAAI